MKRKNFQVEIKPIAYTTLAIFTTMGVTYATLDQQITKVSDIVLGNLAALIVGGGMVVGGGYSCYQGDIARGLAQVGVGALIGIATALAKSKAIFNVLS